MFGLAKYNYESFTRDLLQKHLAVSRTGAGPEPGEQAPDFEARTPDGESIRLSDYRGKQNVVLTFGSLTCPMTAGSIGGMNDIHRKYGKLPNPTFVIDKSGRTAFRALWTQPRVVKDALEALLERQRDRGVEHAIVNGGEDRAFPLSFAMGHAHRALERGGEKSLAEFREALGARGRMVLASSRLAEPVALHPGKALAAAAIAGGVVTAGLLAGRKLREKRLTARQPYDVYESRRPAARTGTDYEPVGI